MPLSPTPAVLLLSLVLIAAPSLSAAWPTGSYFLGKAGESCSEVCFSRSMNCNPAIDTGNSSDIFKSLGVNCTADARPWWAENQPGYVSVSSDPNYGRCLGWVDTPAAVVCSGSYPTVSRVCRCEEPTKEALTFGTGVSAGTIGANESHIFSQVLADGVSGVMSHFWITYSTKTDPGVIVRYYVDGETTASIEFEPSMACGTGFYDPTAPWGTKWFGKGAADGGWTWNLKVPFKKSIRITTQRTTGEAGYYVIVRGGSYQPFNIGGITIPDTARLQQTITSNTFNPLDFVTLASAPAGSSGVHFMTTVAATSGSMNFLEGCFHFYAGNQSFPGTLLSTGTEDFFDSAWYFNAGDFRLPVAGLTHLDNSNGTVSWSAYRFHEMDPLAFNDGFRFDWRIGDSVDAAGIKCFMKSGGRVVGKPTPTAVLAYGWTYVW